MQRPVIPATQLTTQKRYFRPFVIALLVAAGLLGSTAALADPADFQAMPGLWKVILRLVEHGHPGQPKITWHCVDEGADPWIEFAKIDVPGQNQCLVENKHRSSTNLTWTTSCQGAPSATGTGRVDFDSPEHYTASITMKGRGEVVRVEGKRYAACTSPSD